MAGELDVDLVEIAATANPPVCRLMDYGKFKYQEQKRAAEAKAKQTVIEIKEVKFRPGTDDGDYNIKMRNIRRFLADGDAVLYDPHASKALLRRIGPQPTTARFYIPHDDRFLQALLDYVMVSRDLRSKAKRWRIWHPFDDPTCWKTPELREALLTASDHFPVTLDIDL